MPHPSKINVIVISTDPVVLALSTQLSERFPDFTVTTTSIPDGLVPIGPEFDGSIILLDCELSVGGGTVELIRAIRLAGGRVIAISGRDKPGAVVQVMAAGADAALRKSDSARRVGEQVRLATNRGRLIQEREK